MQRTFARSIGRSFIGKADARRASPLIQKTMDAEPRRPVLPHLEAVFDICMLHAMVSEFTFLLPAFRDGNRPAFCTLEGVRDGKEKEVRILGSMFRAAGVKAALNGLELGAMDLDAEEAPKPSPMPRSMDMADGAAAARNLELDFERDSMSRSMQSGRAASLMDFLPDFD